MVMVALVALLIIYLAAMILEPELATAEGVPA